MAKFDDRSRAEKIAARATASSSDNVIAFEQPNSEERFNPLLGVRLAYAAKGMWTFPLRFGSKVSHKSAKYSDGRKWGMSIDSDEIRSDAKRWINANIGLVTGEKSGVVIVETDTIEGHSADGAASLAELEERHGALPPTLQSGTPSGSVHYYFQHPGHHVKNSAGAIAPGIDVRGDGGMVVAVPSVVPARAATADKPARAGGVYRWLNDLPPAPAPQWLLDRIAAGKETPQPELELDEDEADLGLGGDFDEGYGGTTLQWVRDQLRRATAEYAQMKPGNRNHTLNGTAYRFGRWVGGGVISGTEVGASLWRASEQNGLVRDKGIPATQRTLRSGLNAGIAKPRKASQEQASSEGPKPKGWARRRAKDFRDTISKDWIMKGVIAPGEVSNFCGLPKSGKSGLVEDLCLHITAGRDWRGYRSKKQGGIIYFALERADLVERRWNVQARLYGIDPQPLPFHIVSLTIDMMDRNCVDKFVATIREAEADEGVPFIMIVIDTGSKAMAAGGGEENSAKDKNMMRANARRVMDAVEGLHVCLVNHTGKDESKRERGSNAGEGDDDVLIMLNGATAVVERRNDGPTGLLTPYSMKPVILGVDDDGDEVDIAVIDPDTSAPSKEVYGDKEKMTPQQRLAMELLVNCINDAGAPPPPSLKLPKSIIKVVTLEQWREHCVKGGLGGGDAKSSKRAFYRAVETLRAFHKIGIEDDLVWIVY